MSPNKKEEGSKNTGPPGIPTPKTRLESQATDAEVLSNNERYVQVHDYLEIIIGDTRHGAWPKERISKLILGLIDLVRVDKVVSLCLDND